MSAGASEGRLRALAVLALLLNAFVWGVSWWPFRWLAERGVHPLWATVLIYCVAVLLITLRAPRAWAELLSSPGLIGILLAAGGTNACFNWAVSVGDVVRIVLLFYLMPLWSVLLARLLLHEPITPPALLRVGLALAGAAIVLMPEKGSAGSMLPLPRDAVEWLGVAGGFSFALNNVLLRRERARSVEGRALAMFAGGLLVAGALALALGPQRGVPGLPALDWGWLGGAALLSLAFLMANAGLQFGAGHLPAQVTSLVMVSEVLFATVSSVLAGAGQLTGQLALGGGLIVAAALAAAWPSRVRGAA